MNISLTLYEYDRDLCRVYLACFNKTNHRSEQNWQNTEFQTGILMHYAQLDGSFSGIGMVNMVGEEKTDKKPSIWNAGSLLYYDSSDRDGRGKRKNLVTFVKCPKHLCCSDEDEGKKAE